MENQGPVKTRSSGEGPSHFSAQELPASGAHLAHRPTFRGRSKIPFDVAARGGGDPLPVKTRLFGEVPGADLGGNRTNEIS